MSYQWNRLDLWVELDKTSLQILHSQLLKYQMIFAYNSTICDRSNMYQCENSSKCISIHRLMDSIDDCPYLDDENFSETNHTDI